MAVFVCEEIRPIRNLDAYLARKDELIIWDSDRNGCKTGDLYRSTGNHLLVFSIRTPDKSSDKYRFNFLEYRSEIKYVAHIFSDKLQAIEHSKNSIKYISNESVWWNKVWYGDDSVSSLIARMTLANRYDVQAVINRFNTKSSNYSFGWDSSEWDVPVLGEYRHKKEYIGIILHIDKNGNFHIKPSEHNVVLKHNNSDRILYLDCSLRSGYRGQGFYPSKKHFAEISPYDLDRYKILYNALVSVFNIEPIKTGE